LGGSHDDNYQASDREREAGFDGKRKRKKDGGLWSRRGRGWWTLWDKVACLGNLSRGPARNPPFPETQATPSSVVNKHEEFILTRYRGTKYLFFVSVHSIF
jgi:hypothetical protein